MLYGEPVILGIDMDLRRIMAAAEAARSAGTVAHIFSRQCQTDTLMDVIRGDGVRFYNIEDADILSAFGFDSLITEPPVQPFVTEEGGYIHDQIIRDCKETRKPRRKKGTEDQKEDRREDG
jgi:hypothetical protein